MSYCNASNLIDGHGSSLGNILGIMLNYQRALWFLGSLNR